MNHSKKQRRGYLVYRKGSEITVDKGRWVPNHIKIIGHGLVVLLGNTEDALVQILGRQEIEVWHREKYPEQVE